jgi:hypothetical protein
MQGDNPISWLTFFTLAATVFIIAGAFIYFLRSRTNREIAAAAIEGNRTDTGATPSGAGPELIGFAVLAIAAMGLLAAGYSGRSRSETAADDAGWRSNHRNGAARRFIYSAKTLSACQSRARHAFAADVVRCRNGFRERLDRTAEIKSNARTNQIGSMKAPDLFLSRRELRCSPPTY